MKFHEHVERMQELLETLKRQCPRTKENLGDIPNCGVYVFYEKGKAMYAGRSDRLRKRVVEHSGRGFRSNSASFAFNLAKEEKGLLYRTAGRTREELEADPDFHGAFEGAKRRVSQMEIRFVEIEDPITQALFEIYAALELDCKYNDFGTH